MGPINIYKTNRKNMVIILEDDKSITVRAPKHTSNRTIMKFVKEKESWINEKQKLIKEPCELNFRDGMLERIQSLSANGKKEIEILKDEAMNEVKVKAEYFVGVIEELSPGCYRKIRISQAKTRWGSCSFENNISFAWRLVLCPEFVVDYIVVHELCHIIHKNHGKEFWKMVEKYIPNYKIIKKWLCENHQILTFKI